jgi:hypothetical protein
VTLYQELFPKGTTVRIANAQALREFRNSWKLHHPLTEEQLAFADHQATIKSVGFYHGGDVIYELTEAPGTWHEVCLRANAVR